MKKGTLILILFLFITRVYAQEKAQKMSLNECMVYAVENNQSVKKQEFTNNNYKQDYTEAIASMLPSISGSVSTYNNYGRSIDPGTNTYTNTGTFSNTYSVSGQMPVFAGFTNINTLRVAKVIRLMGIEQLQSIKDNLAIETMKAYFNVVYYKNAVEITKEQLATSLRTLEQSRKYEELGLKSTADVAQVESQVASDELLLTQQENSLEIAMLTLKEQMNFPIATPIEVDTNTDHLFASYNSGDSAGFGPNTIADIVDYAIENNPKMRASNYNLRQSKLNYSIAKGRYAPSIYIGGGYSTNYYKNLKSEIVVAPFGEQLRDNRGYYFSTSLSIPIFNGLSRRTNVHRYRNSLKIAEQDNSITARALKTEVTQAALEMKGYEKEYEQATKKVNAADLSYRATLHKYEQGIVSPIDLQTTANQLLLAKSQQLNARLQYIIRTHLVEYYNGEPLIK